MEAVVERRHWSTIHNSLVMSCGVSKMVEVSMLLRRLQVPEVREDLLNGRILNCDGLEDLLTQLDELYSRLLPPWCADASSRAEVSRIAEHHFSCLMLESQECFMIPGNSSGLQDFRYSTLMRVIRKLISCS